MKSDRLQGLERLLDLERLSPTILDQDGKIIPSREAFVWVEREHPDESDAEKYRLAQAWTLLDLYERHRAGS